MMETACTKTIGKKVSLEGRKESQNHNLGRGKPDQRIAARSGKGGPTKLWMIRRIKEQNEIQRRQRGDCLRDEGGKG